jgi:DNA-binding CsgD family transcriptional regulator
VMLETLRAYGTGLLATAGEQPTATVALVGYALRTAEQAAVGLETGIAEALAARRLDAEDATVQQALAWAMDHDSAAGLRLAVALAPWWFLRGRLTGEYTLLRRAASYAAAGSDAWCAAQFWLGYTALLSADLDGALGHFTALRDAGQGPVLASGLAGRSLTLTYLGRAAEAAGDGRRSLALARELGDKAGEARALVNLSIAAYAAGDIQDAAGLARQAGQIPAEVPGSIARAGSNILTMVLTETGDLAAAERVCAAGLARSREVGDLWSLTRLLTQMAILDMRGGRMEDASGCLREALQTAWRTGGRSEVLGALDGCGHLYAATRRHAEAVALWAAHAALSRHEGREGRADWPPSARRRHESLHDARQALGAVRLRAAEERGTAMSLATAAEYALMLTAPAGPPPPETPPGLDRLSARERELVTLVAQGRTDAQIAAHLHISVSTVRSHLDRIRDKTGSRRRADLTRLALGAGLA